MVDAGQVTLNDIGSNFFLDAESLGKSRAERAYELLGELNEDVQGHWVAKDIHSILAEEPNYLSQFSVVIVSNVSQSSARKLAQLCSKDTTFVWVKTVGLVGKARIAIPEHAST